MYDRYVIGLDYGTLSGRAVLVRCRDGYVAAETAEEYEHGVIDEVLPDSPVKLPPDFALQHPQDYLNVLEHTVTEVLKKSGTDPKNVIGIGIDFTACTMLPIDEEGVPLCMKPEWKDHPHAYVKLWKHHGAQRQADRINESIRTEKDMSGMGLGDRVSSELMIPKIMETMECDRSVYENAAAFIEAGDWLTRILTGSSRRSASMAGYKAWWTPENGYPEPAFYEKISPEMKYIVSDKLSGEICEVGKRIGELCAEQAGKLGLLPGIAVAPGMIDSHAGVPGSGMYKKDQMMLAVGTSGVMVALGEGPFSGQGICGACRGGIVPGYYALESGLAAVGDLLEWFIENCVPGSYEREAKQAGIGIHELLTEKASRCPAGSNGLLVLDWWNGNKTPYVDGDFRGVILGLHLKTKPEEIYRALIEGTAFGTRMVMEMFEKAGVQIEEILASGGIAHKNAFFMQIYANVLKKTIKIAGSRQTAASGAAVYAAMAAGKSEGGYDTYQDAVVSMTRQQESCFSPDIEESRIYDKIYQEYCKLGKQVSDPSDNIQKNIRKILDI